MSVSAVDSKSAELVGRLDRLPFSRWHKNLFTLCFLGVMFDACDFALFGMALPATVSYVAFMKVESSSYLKIRLDILYSIYIVFAAAVIVRYAWAIVTLLRGEAPEEADITKTSSGL